MASVMATFDAVLKEHMLKEQPIMTQEMANLIMCGKYKGPVSAVMHREAMALAGNTPDHFILAVEAMASRLRDDYNEARGIRPTEWTLSKGDYEATVSVGGTTPFQGIDREPKHFVLQSGWMVPTPPPRPRIDTDDDDEKTPAKHTAPTTKMYTECSRCHEPFMYPQDQWEKCHGCKTATGT